MKLDKKKSLFFKSVYDPIPELWQMPKLLGFEVNMVQDLNLFEFWITTIKHIFNIYAMLSVVFTMTEIVKWKLVKTLMNLMEKFGDSA